MGAVIEQTSSKSTGEADRSMMLCRAIKVSLEAKRDQIYEEIRGYRPPIPACDVQFNFLLEERTRVFQELSRVNSLAKAKLPTGDLLALLDEFLRMSTCIDAETKQRMRVEVGQAADAV
jgi:hypothetical protein